MIDKFVRHKVASNLLMVMMLLAGVWGLSHLNIQLNPPQPSHHILVNVTWPGASTEDLERLVTQPIEHQMRSLDYQRELSSSSRTGSAQINIHFDYGTDMSWARDAVQQQLDQVRELPTDIEPPQVKLVQNNELIAAVLISGPGNVKELMPLAKQYERELLQRGIDRVELAAMPEEEIAIQIRSQTLLELGLSLNQIAAHLVESSRDLPLGSIGRGQESRELRSLDQQRSVEGFRQLPVLGGDNEQAIRLGEIADIEQRISDNQVTASYEGRPAIILRLRRTQASDTMASAKILRQWLQDKQSELTGNVEVRVYLEAWRFAADQISLVLKNGLSGLLLVMAALFLFLNARVAFWVTLGIPISFLTALAIFYCLGGTINILSMVALVMALGIVVDDAIVVGEHSLTHYEAGHAPADAAAQGANHMLTPIFASSLTTLAAFIPLLTIDSGEIREIPTIMACVIIASLIECFLVMPGHLRGSFDSMRIQKKPPVLRKRFDQAFARFREQQFLPVLRWTLHHRSLTLGLAFATFLIAISLLASGRIKPELSLNISFEFMTADMQFSSGIDQAEKQTYIKKLEQALFAAEQSLGGNLVVTHVVFDGFAYLDREVKRGFDYNAIQVELTSKEQRTVTLEQFAKAWREHIGASTTVEKLQIQSNADFRSNLKLHFKGEDVSTLKTASEELKSVLATYPGVTNIFDDLPYGREQWIFQLSSEARDLGLSTTQIGRQVRSAYHGYRVQIFNRGDRELEVWVRLPASERYKMAQLRQFPIALPDGQMLPLGSLVHIKSRRGIERIQHYDGQLAVNVSASVDNNISTPMAVISDLENNILPGIMNKYGLKYGLSGGTANSQQLLKDLLMGAAIGLALIYIILAWVFSSYTWPLAVMMAIPLGLSGALFGLLLMGMNLGIMAILGVFTLTGVIVNNSIILVNTFKAEQRKGLSPILAAEKAAASRLRAVILTSLTTSLGLMPMLLESSPMGEAMAPLAAVISAGIIYGTTLILLVIPATLCALEIRKEKHAATPISPVPAPSINA
ncbi:MAG: efflux RND transporter permease subunit [Spongiibacteraceae bacterium]|nr:efflux RND transporter permease subunit [Spongiibacteraceae bacterium]